MDLQHMKHRAQTALLHQGHPRMILHMEMYLRVHTVSAQPKAVGVPGGSVAWQGKASLALAKPHSSMGLPLPLPLGSEVLPEAPRSSVPQCL